MLWQSWEDERLAMRGLKRAKIGDSTQFWLIFAVSFLFFYQYELHFVNNVAQASSHTKSHVVAVKRGSNVSYQGPQKGQKWWIDLVLINSFCYFSCFSTNTFTSTSTSTNTNYNLWENAAQASSSYIVLRFHVVTIKRGWMVSHHGDQKGQK